MVTPPRSRALVIAAVTAAWGAIGLLLAAQAYVSGRLRGEDIDAVRAAAIWLGWALSWALLTPAALRLHRHFRQGRRSVALHALAAPLFAVVNLALFAGIAPLVGAQNTAATYGETFRNLLASALLVNIPLYFLIVGMAHWRHLAHTAHERKVRQLALEHQLAQARLSALQAQLQPHFLFNALNTIAVTMRENVDDAERVLFALAALLRSALQASHDRCVPLSEDFRLARAYLEVEKARFGERLEYHFEADADAERALVPPLLLQPLVENCVRHAVNRRTRTTTIRVSARTAGETLHLSVRDDGPGLASPQREGIGLSNTRARLALLYAHAHRFALAEAPGDGVEVCLAVPYRDRDEDTHADRR